MSHASCMTKWKQKRLKETCNRCEVWTSHFHDRSFNFLRTSHTMQVHKKHTWGWWFRFFLLLLFCWLFLCRLFFLLFLFWLFFFLLLWLGLSPWLFLHNEKKTSNKPNKYYNRTNANDSMSKKKKYHKENIMPTMRN